MTGPSGSEPLNKKFKWYKMSLEWINNYKNVYSNCPNCTQCINNNNSRISNNGINGFCWDCQKNGSQNMHLVEKLQPQEEDAELGWNDNPNTPTPITELDWYDGQQDSENVYRTLPNLAWATPDYEETKTSN